MKKKLYMNNNRFLAGMTMKDTAELEDNNMALHTCLNPHNVLKNRKKLAAAINCEWDAFICAEQTHSENFYRVTIADIGRGATDTASAIANTDALYTYAPNLLLCCFTADCVPVIFTNNANGLIGVIHSGWKGTVKEITWKVLTHLIHKENCKPHDFHIYIGAAISQHKFEVDHDVYRKFKHLEYADDYIFYNEKKNKYYIDNKQTVKKQCELAGIPMEQIYIDPTCTYTSADGFSYRENKENGRHMSFIMRKRK